MVSPAPGPRGPGARGHLAIDPERYEVTVDGRSVGLTYLEYQLLFAVARASGRVLTYDQLAALLWPTAVPNPRRRLTVLVSRLRRRLGSAGAHIRTVKHVGYRLDCSEQSAPDLEDRAARA